MVFEINVKLTSKELQILRYILNLSFQERNWPYIPQDVLQEEYRWSELEKILLVLYAENLIYSPSKESFFEISITGKGITVLTNYGIDTVISSGLPQTILKKLPYNMSWLYRGEVRTLLKQLGSHNDVLLALRVLEDFSLVECNYASAQMRFPYSLRITRVGRRYYKEQRFFFHYITYDAQQFKLQYSDTQLLTWFLTRPDHENNYIEFKEKLPPPPEIRRQITGMANGDSGILCIGIRDNRDVIGVDNPDQIKRQIWQNMRNYDINLKARVIQNEQHKKVILVMVPSTKEVIPVGSRVYVRVDGEVQTKTPAEVIQITQKKLKANRLGYLFLLDIAIELGNH